MAQTRRSVVLGGAAASAAFGLGIAGMAVAEERQGDAPAVILIHGQSLGGWCFAPIVENLRGLGHRVYAPTLTGLGERRHLIAAATSVDVHVEDIANVILFEELRRVVLVGYSYGGVVATGVAAQMPERIAKIIFLDAVLPEPGKSVVDLFSPAFAEQFSARVKDGLVATQPAERSSFFAKEPERARSIAARLVPHPYATYTTPLRFDPAVIEALSRDYLFFRSQSGGWALGPQIEAVKARHGSRFFELPGEHDLVLAEPGRVAAALAQRLSAL